MIAIPFLALFLFISFYAEPIADDYAYAYRLQLRPFWDAYVHEYISWNGRYSSNFLVLLNRYVITHRFLYHLSGFAVILCLVFSTYFLLKPFLKRRRALAFSLVIVAVYLGCSARISETIYWFTGAMTYTMGTVFTLIAIGSLYRFAHSGKAMWGALAGACMAVAIGTNEVSMALNLLMALAYAFKRERNWPVVLLVAAIASLIVFLAPGNEVRSELFENTHQVFYSAGMAVLQTVRFTGVSLAYLPLPLTVIYLWSRVDFKSIDANLIKSIEKWPMPLILAGVFIPLFLSAFLPYYATGILGQHRTMAFGQYYLTAGLLALPILVFAKRPILFSWVRDGVRKIPKWPLVTGILASSIFLGNSGEALTEAATGKLADQQKELLFREAQITQAKGDTLLRFAPLDTTVLFVIDIAENSNHWINAHQSSVLNPKAEVRMERRGGR